MCVVSDSLIYISIHLYLSQVTRLHTLFVFEESWSDISRDVFGATELGVTKI